MDLLILTASVLVVSINVVICLILELVTQLEKAHSQNDETLSKFYKISIMQFINYSILTLLINQKIEGFENYYFLGLIPLLQGKYDEFSADWYRKIGSTLGLTLTLNIFSPHFSKLAVPIFKFILRFYDRGWRCDLQYTEYKPPKSKCRAFCCCKEKKPVD